MKGCILVIEDSPTSRALADYLLDAAGYQVLMASDGEAGIAVARLGHPDLVLCDINLPTIDGYDVLRIFAGEPDLSSIPILAYTAADELEERERIFAAGFAGFVAKPITREFIQQELETYFAPGR